MRVGLTVQNAGMWLPHHLALLFSSLLLAGLMGLGLSLQLGWRSIRLRWLHHLLFFLVVAGVLVTTLLTWQAGRPFWFLLAPLALLLSMPATRPGRANHWQRALLCAGAMLLVWPLVW